MGETMAGTESKQTGIAWFNYAIVTPVPVPGRVNVNTAPPRFLASLPGINSELAKNIYDGRDTDGKQTLKPYQKLGDVLKVKAMTPKIFERCANIFALDSSFFTVEVEAQLFKDSSRILEKSNGQVISSKREYYQKKLAAGCILASRTKRFIIDAVKKDDEHLKFVELENISVR